jgi:hypothetical protein
LISRFAAAQALLAKIPLAARSTSVFGARPTAEDMGLEPGPVTETPMVPGMPMPKRQEVDTELDRVVEAPHMVQRAVRRSVMVRRPTATVRTAPFFNET